MNDGSLCEINKYLPGVDCARPAKHAWGHGSIIQVCDFHYQLNPTGTLTEMLTELFRLRGEATRNIYHSNSKPFGNCIDCVMLNDARAQSKAAMHKVVLANGETMEIHYGGTYPATGLCLQHARERAAAENGVVADLLWPQSVAEDERETRQDEDEQSTGL
jgi:hypothetical protein